MKILIVGDVFPWPPVSGHRMRLGATIAALQTFGSVDLFSLVNPEDGPFDVVDRPPRLRYGVAARRRAPFSWHRELAWVARGELPASIARLDADELRRAFCAWRGGSDTSEYDLVWFRRLENYVVLRPVVRARRTVVDLDDLEDVRALMTIEAAAHGAPLAKLRHAPGVVDARRWRDLQDRVVRESDCAVVCSDADRDRKIHVLPNCYRLEGPPKGRIHAGDSRPVILFIGKLSYGPNVDAVRRLVHDVLPRLRSLGCDPQVRLVGRASPAVEELSAVRGVEVTGFVDDIGDELARAWLVAAPFRLGTGTRLKILESFAHRIPVVTTTIGAYGLDVRDGVHVVIRDDLDAFAASCAALIDDPGRRRGLTQAAHQLWRDRYRWDVADGEIRRIVASVAGPLAGGSPRSGGPSGSPSTDPLP